MVMCAFLVEEWVQFLKVQDVGVRECCLQSVRGEIVSWLE
jgi:hypothetical protein